MHEYPHQLRYRGLLCYCAGLSTAVIVAVDECATAISVNRLVLLYSCCSGLPLLFYESAFV